jgi:hypothetical protein
MVSDVQYEELLAEVQSMKDRAEKFLGLVLPAIVSQSLPLVPKTDGNKRFQHQISAPELSNTPPDPQQEFQREAWKLRQRKHRRRQKELKGKTAATTRAKPSKLPDHTIVTDWSDVFYQDIGLLNMGSTMYSVS